ncbi:putative restriction enzyme [Mammaliicoccus lentus]|uniref:AAA family ATPase n=1 Tax=Mammaliicoccus lentus TaxID=42858 RepID=UPI00085BDEC9|nr:AAA family ATPase [Mammaliicoccus lentus]SCU44024.1 putative restriction enzyme [Mammaliicoccus lentus]
MKLIINNKLWNKMNKFISVGNKPTILKNIEDNNKVLDNTYTNDPVTFFEHMRRSILNKIKDELSQITQESWDPIINFSDIEKGDTGGEYVAHLVSNNGDWLSDIIIAYGDKAGNTLISQQVNKFILNKLDQEGDISYIYKKGIQKILYLTYDLNQKEYASTIEQVIRSLSSLEFNIIEMFPSENSFPSFSSAQEAFDFYKKSRRANSSVEIEQDESKLILRKNNSTPIGSGFYMFSVLLLSYYKLSHPQLGFDRLEFRVGDLQEASTVTIAQYLQSIYDGSFYKAQAFKKFDISIYEGNQRNVLIYGAPGTGKSYYIEKQIKPNYDGRIERVTFYEDFDYTDFVGGLKPTRDQYNQINYNFIPGAFTRILVDALNNPDKTHLLIIEELNRANAASVFGDVFQLLDRDENGTSQYEIYAGELAEYLDEKVIGFSKFKETGIKIPGNFAIYATMNPADQSVQQIDSAFKRRWDMEYLPIDFNTSEDNIGEIKVKGFNKSWKDVGEAINRYLVNLGVDEDSRIGQHFLTKRQLQDISSVASKLLGYLWNDAVPYQRTEVFKLDTLADVIYTFKLDSPTSISDVFSDKFLKETNL